VAFTRGEGGVIESHVGQDLKLEFNACRGIRASDASRKDNDLSSYINKLVRDENMIPAMQENAYNVLVGYANPNDNANEAACSSKYQALTNLPYK
jgi:hypothetical protein